MGAVAMRRSLSLAPTLLKAPTPKIRLLAPAIDYAENGYPVSERISNDWTIPSLQGVTKAQGSIGHDPDTIVAWTINGQSPLPGQIFKNPDLAHTFKLIAEQGPSVFYRGEIAQAIVAKSRKLGGTMTLADLANYSGYWRTPPSTTLRRLYNL
jgi:gamma-glutamyltranspeptidase / glutathione hydrolase